MVLQAVKYERGSLEIIDQLRLPHTEDYLQIHDSKAAWHAIKSMQVRGAPAIAIVAALSIAVDLTRERNQANGVSPDIAQGHLHDRIAKDLDYLVTSRPTAVNLRDAAQKLRQVIDTAQNESGNDDQVIAEAYITAAETMLSQDVADNHKIGSFGVSWIQKHCDFAQNGQKISVLTHCNTGSLATAGYGTALGIIRSLHAHGMLQHAFYTETRPYNQGARLTGYELIHDGIPATLLTDSMAAALLKLRKDIDRIACIIVGADRVAANGDTANKIGTYALAVLARFHNVKFIVAAPWTTIDLDTKHGDEIVIEQRPEQELVTIKGQDVSPSAESASTRHISLAHKKTKAWNPSFDVTPANLIDAIITEKGAISKGIDGTFECSSQVPKST